MVLRAAEDHYREQAALAVVVHRQVGALWSRVSPDAVDAWRALLPQAAAVVTAAQFRAASAADEYVAEALSQQGLRVAPVARVAPEGFAGVASDGRSLVSLLDEPRIGALTDIGSGVGAREALRRAGSRLQRMAVTQVQDAGRQADGVAIFARPKIGWVRMVNPPCCGDCAILAGKWFKSNQGFPRHPHCDCRHVPMSETDTPWEGPGGSLQELFTSGKVTGVSDAEVQAVADGADPVQVINARRGRSADKMYTTEGTTRRGVASKSIREARPSVRETARNVGPRGATRNYVERRVVRPTPEGIYKYANDRDEALKLLRDFGYIR